MCTTLYQTLTSIIFASLLFAGPISSSAQVNDDWHGEPSDNPSGFNLPSPNTPELPTVNDANVSPAPALPIPLHDVFNPEISHRSPPPPPVESINRKLPPEEFQNTTREGESDNTGKLNKGKKFGLAFLAVAVVLQIVLGGFLMYKRRKIANF